MTAIIIKIKTFRIRFLFPSFVSGSAMHSMSKPANLSPPPTSIKIKKYLIASLIVPITYLAKFRNILSVYSLLLMPPPFLAIKNSCINFGVPSAVAIQAIAHIGCNVKQRAIENRSKMIWIVQVNPICKNFLIDILNVPPSLSISPTHVIDKLYFNTISSNPCLMKKI